MIDQRELILVRLFTLLGELPGIKTVYRNGSELTEAEKPGAVLLDGVETILTNPARRNIVQMPPAEFVLRPQVFIVLPMADNIKTNLNVTVLGTPYAATEVGGQPMSPVGPLISQYRATVVSGVLNDQNLVSLVGPNGQIILEGMETDMQTGSTVGAFGATAMFRFALTYVLNPSQLQ